MAWRAKWPSAEGRYWVAMYYEANWHVFTAEVSPFAGRLRYYNVDQQAVINRGIYDRFIRWWTEPIVEPPTDRLKPPRDT